MACRRTSPSGSRKTFPLASTSPFTNEARKRNVEALKRFLRQAKTELEKEDFVSLEITLSQALGRVKNLRMLEDLENAN